MKSAIPLLFVKESIRDFKNTGAIAPSSSFLAKAIVKALPAQINNDNFKVLEVGPGTGVFTRKIVKRMCGRGYLDLCEISSQFVERLKSNLSIDPHFSDMRDRIRVLQLDPRELRAEAQYDVIISGLPFNNFSSEDVASFLEQFQKIVKPGGALAFFEYLAIRKIQYPFCGKDRRSRLSRIAKIVKKYANTYQVRQEIVALNVPPARVRVFHF